MLLRPNKHDFQHIVHDLGIVLAVAGGAGLFPLVWAVGYREWRSAADLVLMIGVGVAIGGATQAFRPATRKRVDWSHGLVVVSLTWLLVPAIGAIPLYLSGHFAGFHDAYFDSMSGVTTTGLSVLQDLDHLPVSINIWRHTLHFLGGQGIVLAALTFFAASGALSLYQAEGRDERIFPSVGSTARFIWLVSLVYLVAGVLALTLDGIFIQGFEPMRALFHALTIFMAAFDTGGFAPMSSSVAYYRSGAFETVVAVLMIAGAMSFGLHHAIWNRRKGLIENLEIRTILGTTVLTLGLTTVGLAAIGAFSGVEALTRRSLFHVLSAHSGTGFATVTSAELNRWSGLAYAGIALAMALGGMSSSTAGGVKSLRIGLTLRAMYDTVRSALLPDRSVIPASYKQYGRQRLDPRLATSVMSMSLLYVALYLGGAAVAIAYGYPLEQALFESVSASANVGLSVGVTSPSMPGLLQTVMIAQMWVGRLEFVAAFALFGFLVSWVTGK